MKSQSTPTIGFQYLIELHYSQTVTMINKKIYTVSVPYRITLLSNGVQPPLLGFLVSVPYRITLLSNAIPKGSDL